MRGLFAGKKEDPPKTNASLHNPTADPLLGKAPSPQPTVVAGVVYNRDKQAIPEAYVSWESADEPDSSGAPIDIATQPDGSFTIRNLQSGKRYRLIARARQGDRLLATTVYAQAPDVHLAIYLTEPAGPGTPPIPPMTLPGQKPLPGQDKAAPKKALHRDDGNQMPHVGALLVPPQPGFGIGRPQPRPDLDDPNPPAANWNQPTGPKNFVPGIAAGPGLVPAPLMQIREPNDSIPQPGSPPAPEPPPPLPPSPSALPPSGLTTGSAEVPSCILLGNKLENFALPEFSGKPWEWKRDRKGKLVLLDFWKTDCPPCLRSIPTLCMLQGKYGKYGLEVIGIAYEASASLEEQKSNIAKTCQRLQTNYLHLLGTSSKDPVCTQFRVHHLPKMVLLDETGTILWQHVGALDGAELELLQRQLKNRLRAP